jgi:hypothetical protein
MDTRVVPNPSSPSCHRKKRRERGEFARTLCRVKGFYYLPVPWEQRILVANASSSANRHGPYMEDLLLLVA